MIEILGTIGGILILGTIGLSSIYTVRPTERGLVERLGKYRAFAGQGLHFKIPIVDRVLKVNVTEQMVDAEAQEVITIDNLNAKVDAQVYFKVKATEDDVKRSQYNVDDYEIQIVALARTTLRDIIGRLSFKEVNSMREKLNMKLGKELDEQTNGWGIQVVRTELKEIEPPNDVQETMNKVLKAQNEMIAAKDYATATETEADGLKRSEIKKAEGAARAVELEAEAEKKAKVLIASGEASAIKLVNESAQKYFKGNAVELKKLETAERTLKNNTKVIATDKTAIGELIAYVAGIDASRSEPKAKPKKK